MTKKRDIFSELTEGFDGLKSEREGKCGRQPESVLFQPE